MDRDAVAGALEELSLSPSWRGKPVQGSRLRGGARAISRSGKRLDDLLRPGELESVPGVGRGIAALVREIVKTAVHVPLAAPARGGSAGVRDLLSVSRPGPKKVRLLWLNLGILSLGELEYACLETAYRPSRASGPRRRPRCSRGSGSGSATPGESSSPKPWNPAGDGGLLRADGPSRWAWVGQVAVSAKPSGYSRSSPPSGTESLAGTLGLEPSEGGFAGVSPEG